MTSNLTANFPENVAVELVLNCFERNYLSVLQPGFIESIESQNQSRFSLRTILINNVADMNLACSMAESLKASGGIDRYFVVDELVDVSLKKMGLKRSDFGRLSNWSFPPLVALALEGCRFVLYWDPDMKLAVDVDWVRPSLELLLQNNRILVANPGWWTEDILIREAELDSENYTLSYGFSDQIFLCERSRLVGNHYNAFSPASLRFPTSHIETLFEQRVDAYMRAKRLFRCSIKHVRTAPHTGQNYPPRSFAESCKAYVHRQILAFLNSHNFIDPRFRIAPLIRTERNRDKRDCDKRN